MKNARMYFLIVVALFVVIGCGPRIYVDGKSSPATTKLAFVNGNTKQKIEYLVRVPYYTEQWVHVGRGDTHTEPVNCFTGFVTFEYYVLYEGNLRRGSMRKFTFFVRPSPDGLRLIRLEGANL